jgi:DNA-binding transcriptional ArsR family regulator
MAPLTELSSIQLAEFFSAFSDSSRLRIIECLMKNEELSVGDIAERVELSESATSHQLRTLRQMRAVRTQKIGRSVFYELDDEHVKEIMEIGIRHISHNKKKD